MYYVITFSQKYDCIDFIHTCLNGKVFSIVNLGNSTSTWRGRSMPSSTTLANVVGFNLLSIFSTPVIKVFIKILMLSNN